VVSVDESGAQGSVIRIMPNPVVQESTIRFVLPQAGMSRVRIIDPAGRLVRRLQAGWTPAGPQQHRWDGRDRSGARVDAGVYFLVVDAAGGFRDRGKLVIVR
jgi:flagellar hook assembly protein FlgD